MVKPRGHFILLQHIGCWEFLLLLPHLLSHFPHYSFIFLGHQRLRLATSLGESGRHQPEGFSLELNRFLQTSNSRTDLRFSHINSVRCQKPVSSLSEGHLETFLPGSGRSRPSGQTKGNPCTCSFCFLYLIFENFGLLYEFFLDKPTRHSCLAQPLEGVVAAPKLSQRHRVGATFCTVFAAKCS